jgi:alpha/beta superfamily hydrolase
MHMADRVEAMNREEAVWIDGPNGRLFGIVHHPEQASSPPACVIMVNSGHLNRTGPQRLYVIAAREWARHGLMVLRIDLAGIGDSAPVKLVMHFDGLLIGDIGAAVEYARRELKARSIYVQGLCAGARAAIRYAATDDRLAGVLAWSCPIVSSGPGLPPSPYEKPQHVSAFRARSTVSQPLASVRELKFLRLWWWRNRLRHGARELSQIGISLWHLVKGEKQGSNPFLAAADKLMDGSHRILWVYGASDHVPLGEFRDRYANVPEDSTAARGYCVIPYGTHTFNAVESQAAAIDLTRRWIEHSRQAVAESKGWTAAARHGLPPAFSKP